MSSLKNGNSPEKKKSTLKNKKASALKLINKSELARQRNCSPQYISMIMSGKRKGRKHQGAIIATIQPVYEAINRIAN